MRKTASKSILLDIYQYQRCLTRQYTQKCLAINIQTKVKPDSTDWTFNRYTFVFIISVIIKHFKLECRTAGWRQSCCFHATVPFIFVTVSSTQSLAAICLLLIAGLFELQRNNSRNLDCNQDLPEWEQRSQGNCTFFRLDGDKSALILPPINSGRSSWFHLTSMKEMIYIFRIRLKLSRAPVS